MDRKELEIMAPAGNFECLSAAIQGGADAVYFGVGRLNMRSNSANNFKPEELCDVEVFSLFVILVGTEIRYWMWRW